MSDNECSAMFRYLRTEECVDESNSIIPAKAVAIFLSFEREDANPTGIAMARPHLTRTLEFTIAAERLGYVMPMTSLALSNALIDVHAKEATSGNPVNAVRDLILRPPNNIMTRRMPTA